MRNGLYKVEFKVLNNFGAGVVHAVDGKIWGGDSAIYYVGSYSVAGSKLSAKVAANRHTPGIPSVFGIDKVNITLDGTTSGDTVTCSGKATEAPGVVFQAKLTRISD